MEHKDEIKKILIETYFLNEEEALEILESEDAEYKELFEEAIQEATVGTETTKGKIAATGARVIAGV